MTGFELVKVALDALYAEALQTYGPNTDATIAARIQYLSTSYSGLNNPKRPPVNYQDPATRFAYVFKYVASHSDYIVQVMEAWRSHVGGQIMAGADTMRITCVGGGPGSDLIGFLRYLDENKNEPIKKATAYLLDREQAWAAGRNSTTRSSPALYSMRTSSRSTSLTPPRGCTKRSFCRPISSP